MYEFFFNLQSSPHPHSAFFSVGSFRVFVSQKMRVGKIAHNMEKSGIFLR